MVSMEDNNNDQASSYSWWWHSHNCSHQSQWLQTTLADLDKRTKVMLNLIQEDGDSFAKRAEMYYKRRPELIKMVEDFHRSYRSLAEKYDQLRSECINQVCDKPNPENTKPEAPNSHPEDPELESEASNFNLDSLNTKMKPEINGDFNREVNKTNGGTESDDNNMGGDYQMGSLEREKMWNELRLKVSTLIDDNLRQQDELVRRNDEKRAAIKDLCFQINGLMDENRALKNCLTCSKVDVKQNQSQVSKLKGLFLGKFSG